jgi:hypothetical protein
MAALSLAFTPESICDQSLVSGGCGDLMADTLSAAALLLDEATADIAVGKPARRS